MASSSSTIYPDQVARLESYNAAICRIVRIADDRPLGTGFLIAPGVVMTCHHVVPKSAKPGECRAEFYGTAIVDQSDLSTRKVVYFEAIAFDADESKYITSPQNFDAAGKLIAADAGKLDYSILSLKTNPKLAKVRYFDLFNACTASMIEQLSTAHVFQHPDIESRDVSGLWIKSHAIPSSSSSKKKTKKILTRGEFNLATGPLRKCGEFEIHYASETAPGSSGGPVTDAMGNLAALHYQGKITDCDCPKSTAVPHCNVGVRIDQIVEDLRITGSRQQVEDLIKQNTLCIHSRIRQYMADFYQNQRTVSVLGGDWLFSVDDVYTDLVIIGESERREQRDKKEPFQDRRIPTHETLYQPKHPVKINQLFEHEKLKNVSKKRAIVYGVAGVGKTTFSEMAAIHGAQLWPNQFRSAFLIKLRNLNKDNYPNLGKDYSVEEVLANEYRISLSNSAVSSSIEFQCSLKDLREFLQSESFKKESLLILDGFDELPVEANNGKGPLRNLIRDLEKAFDHILITCRPGTVKFCNVEMDCKTEFEITGFDKTSIDCYIKHFYVQLEARGKIPLGSDAQDKTAKLCAILRSRPVLHNLVHIPINLVLICSIYNEDEACIDSTETFSLTDFYVSTVDWLYKRFFDRPDVGLDFQRDPDFDPSSTSLFQDLNLALQIIAWEAMRKDSIQINQQTVTEIIRKNRKLFQKPDHIVGHLKKVGLMKFEPTRSSTKPGMGTWEFIHLTFQEYFAAVYLANDYLKGDLDEAKKLLIKIKFNPNYRLMLKMTAGYLSLEASKNAINQSALQTFFDHLFGEPTDLARNSLLLFGECFEECKNPGGIQPHYFNFIEDCKRCFYSAINCDLFELLINKSKLLHHMDIINAIIDLLHYPEEEYAMTDVLFRLASHRQDLPIRIVQILVNLLIENSGMMKVLLEIGIGNGRAQLEAEKMIIKLVKDKELDLRARMRVMLALNNTVSLVAIDALRTIAADLEDNSNARVQAIEILEFIAKRGGMLFHGVMSTLVEIICRKTEKGVLRGSAVVAMGYLVEKIETVNEEMHCALLEMILDPDLYEYYVDQVTDVLIKITKKEVTIAQKMLIDFDSIVRNESLGFEIRCRAGRTLTKIAIVNRIETDTIRGFLGILVTTLRIKRFRVSAAENIQWMRREGRGNVLEVINIVLGEVNFSEVVKVLIETLIDAGDPQSNRSKAVLILKEMIGEEGEGIAALDIVQMITRAFLGPSSDFLMIRDVLSVLEKIADSGKTIPVEVFQVLVSKYRKCSGWLMNSEMAGNGLANIVQKTILHQTIEEETIVLITQMMQELCLDSGFGVRAGTFSSIMKDIAVRNGFQAEEALSVLVTIVRSPIHELSVRKRIVLYLREVAEAGGDIADQAFRAIVETVDIDDPLKGYVVSALGYLACRYDKYSSRVWEVLISIINVPCLREPVFGKILSTLFHMVERGSTIPKEFLHALIRAMPQEELLMLGYSSVAIKHHSNYRFPLDVGPYSRTKVLTTLWMIILREMYVLLYMEQSIETVILEQLGNLVKRVLSSESDIRTIEMGILALGGIARRKEKVVISKAVVVLSEILQNLNVREYFREYAGWTLGILASEGGEVPQKVLRSIIGGSSRYTFGKVLAVGVLGMIAKKKGVVSQKSLDAIIELYHDFESKGRGDINEIIVALGGIVEQGGTIAQEALHTLVMMVHYGMHIGPIIQVLRRINSKTLIELITAPSSCQLVFGVCLLTSRVFMIFERNIFISDHFRQVSASCPEEISHEISYWKDLFWSQSIRSGCLRLSTSVDSSASSSSLSSSSSISDSAHDSTSVDVFTPISTTTPLNEGSGSPFVLFHSGNPYLLLDDVFEGVYKEVMKEENLRILMTSLIDQNQEPIKTPKDRLVNYLIDQCVSAICQNKSFLELKKRWSYISIADPKKMALYYSIRQSSWIEECLTKIGYFSPPPPIPFSNVAWNEIHLGLYKE